MRFPLFLLTLLLAMLLAPPGASAQRKKGDEPPLPKPPPQPVPLTLKVARGGRLEIPLRIYGMSAEEPRFLIRSAPTGGRLSPPKSVGRAAAQVVYQPSDDLSVKADKFTYAAQTSAGVSAAADVAITIVDEPALLVVTDELRFEALLAGKTARQEIEIVNQGGSVAEGTAEVGTPWRLEGDARYRLKGGERKKLAVVFAPTEGGPAKGEVRYSSQPDHVTTLRGVSEMPLMLTPPALILAHPAGDPQRAGVVEVANHTAQEMTVAIEPVPRLRLPPALQVAAGEKVLLTVSMETGDTAVLPETFVSLRGPGMEARLPVSAAGVEAMLRAPGGPVRLPPGSATQPPSVTTVLMNAGGTEGFWKATAPPPFEAEPAHFRIPPGGEQPLTLRCLAPAAGHYEGSVQFVGEQQTVTLAVEAEAQAEAPRAPVARPASPASAHMAAGPSARTQMRTAAAAPVDDPAEEAAGSGIEVHVVRGVRILEAAPHRIRMQWPTAISSGRPVRLEISSLKVDAEGKLYEAWNPAPNVKLTANGAVTVAEIDKLRAATAHSLRLVLAQEDPSTPALFRTDAITPPAISWWRTHLVKIGFFILAGLGGLWFWRRSRQTF